MLLGSSLENSERPAQYPIAQSMSSDMFAKMAEEMAQEQIKNAFCMSMQGGMGGMGSMGGTGHMGAMQPPPPMAYNGSYNGMGRGGE